MNNINNFWIAILPSIFFISAGLWSLFGGAKAAYLAHHARSGGVYAFIPWGVSWLIILASFAISSDGNDVLFYIGVGIFILGIIFAGFPPPFLKPAWLRWLEREHGDIYWLLENEAHEMGLREWQKRVKTQEGLEEWVSEMRQKHELE